MNFSNLILKILYIICSTNNIFNLCKYHSGKIFFEFILCFWCYNDWKFCIVPCSFSRVSFFFIYLFIESLDILLSMHNCSCRTLECTMFAYKLSFTNWFWMSEHTYDERLDNDLSSSCHYQLDQQKKNTYICTIYTYDISIYTRLSLLQIFLLFTFHITFWVINDIYSFHYSIENS